MKSSEVRERFISFYKKRDHKILPSASLVPENDPSVLFTTAGMQPLVPYLLGQKHPEGARLANVQKCIRTNDIEEVGDSTHGTFFEMLGNWSLGDYWKKEAIEFTYQFLTSKKEGLGLDPNRIYITVFEGDENAPKDTESSNIWKDVGIPANRIYELGADSNWWSPGDNGPCGPDTEIFYDLTEGGLGDMSKDEYLAADDRQDVVEIGNNVFMEYLKKDGEIVGRLDQKNVDFGGGFERQVMAVQLKTSVYKTDIYEKPIEFLNKLGSDNDNTSAKYIICDHIRAACFMISDGVSPSNTDQGYILRRLIRRSIIQGQKINLEYKDYQNLINLFVEKYKDYYSSLKNEKINTTFKEEFENFSNTLIRGMREFDKVSGSDITGEQAFKLFTTYGFPLELTKEIAKERELSVDEKSFKKEMKKHKQASKVGSSKKFKGGLANQGEMAVKYHTATHLLQAALRDVLGTHVEQRGSNITEKRLRFDFTHNEKLSDEEKMEVENWVNDKISKKLDVVCDETSKNDALESGALGVFKDKYGDQVTVYTIGDNDEVVSRELCGGPHVQNTNELGHFKITKETSSSAGVRRIKAILE